MLESVVWCNNQPQEFVAHLFLDCSFARRTWKRVKEKLGVKGQPTSLIYLWTEWRKCRFGSACACLFLGILAGKEHSYLSEEMEFSDAFVSSNK